MLPKTNRDIFKPLPRYFHINPTHYKLAKHKYMGREFLAHRRQLLFQLTSVNLDFVGILVTYNLCPSALFHFRSIRFISSHFRTKQTKVSTMPRATKFSSVRYGPNRVIIIRSR